MVYHLKIYLGKVLKMEILVIEIPHRGKPKGYVIDDSKLEDIEIGSLQARLTITLEEAKEILLENHEHCV